MNQRMTIRKSEKENYISITLHNFMFRNKTFLLFYSTQRPLKRSTQSPPSLFLNGSLFFQEKMCHDMFIVSGYDRSCNSIDIWLPKKDKNIWIFAPKVTFIYFSEHLSFCAQWLVVCLASTTTAQPAVVCRASTTTAQPSSAEQCLH